MGLLYTIVTSDIQGMSDKRSWDLAVKAEKLGSAEVWRGPFEQSELYHQQLVNK